MSQRFEGRLFQFDRSQGYGFVRDPDGGQDLFVHVNEMDEISRNTASGGSHLEFEIVDGDRGPRAVEITVVDSGEQASVTEYRQELTELLIKQVPALTAGQLGQVRDVATELARARNWIS
ncbi:MAG: cold shock domain-containing protein [Actinomycetia bacterium]|nr:cold shock domain-containing protein [Actinomycetes bacterium]MCP3911948.1 cold shock domain-containing protein [Actinomycetes bacterium]MCP4085289.1 cold shock domain-containing protein [Actinomycetes bacterium]